MTHTTGGRAVQIPIKFGTHSALTDERGGDGSKPLPPRPATVMPPAYASARKRDNLAICWLVFLGWVLAAPPVFAARPQGVTLEGVQAKLSKIQAKKGLPEDLKTRLVSLYQLAQHHLETAQELETRATSYQQAIASAPGETRRLRALLAQAPAERPPEADLDTAPIPSWNGSWSLRRPVLAP